MSDYFIKTKRPLWNIDDAFDSFTTQNPDLAVEQQLSRFHDFLKKQKDPLVQSWLLKWKSFCKKPEKPKTRHTKINLDMSRSVNQNVTIGNINNYNNKREFEDDVERVPRKKANSGNADNRSDKRFDDLFSEEEEAVDITDADAFKEAVFKAGYQYFKGELPLSTIANLNKLYKGFSPNTLGEYLDLLSYELLNKEMNINEKNTLKFSLSHIISFVAPTAVVFETFFSKQNPAARNLYQEVKSKLPILPNGMSETAKQMIDDILIVDGSEHLLRQKINEKKAKLLETTCDGEEMQILDIMEYIVQCTKRKSYRHTSELTCYRMSAHIFDLILNDTCLQMIDGENCSQATKYAQQENQKICSDDDTKKLIGRKIDLIIAEYDVELSSSEWKKSQTTPTTIEQQRVKNLRSNCAILNKILSLPISDANKISIFAMDWLGMIGCRYAIDTFDDIFSIHYAGDLVIPESIDTLFSLKETLDLLYSFKHHHINLTRSIRPAVEKAKILDQLRKLRPELSNDTNKKAGPLVFFTPTAKRQRKANNE